MRLHKTNNDRSIYVALYKGGLKFIIDKSKMTTNKQLLAEALQVLELEERMVENSTYDSIKTAYLQATSDIKRKAREGWRRP